MRIISWSACLALGVLGASSFAVAGCTSTTTVNNGNDDSGIGNPDDAGDGSVGTPAPDSGTGADTGTTDDGAVTCGVLTDTGNTTCDTCLETQCCSTLEACYGTDTSPDAAATGCQQLVGCIQDYEAATPDAGVADALDTCAPDGGTTYTANEITNATALLGCLGDGNPSGACAASCPASTMMVTADQ